jgi:predicted RNase H-like HicB family nuclease
MKLIKNYEFRVIPSEEKNYFAVRFPDFPGIITGGGTIEAALKNAEEALDLTLSVMKERGLEPPKTKVSSPSLNRYVPGVVRAAHAAPASPNRWRRDMPKTHFPKGLDNRMRDAGGEIRKKRSDTLVSTLRGEYGPNVAEGYRANTKLGTVLKKEGLESLDQLLKKRK